MASNLVKTEYQARKRPPSLYGSIRLCLKCWGKNDKWVRIPNYRAQIQTWNLTSMNQNFHQLDHEVRPLRLTEVTTPYARVSPKISFRAIWIRKFGTQTDSHYISGIGRLAITAYFSAEAKSRLSQIWRFFISNFRLVLNVVFFFFRDSPASEFYVPTFRNTVSFIFIDGVSLHHLWRWNRVFRNVGT